MRATTKREHATAERTSIPRIIPPGSVVKLVRSDHHTPMWRDRIGAMFMVGYYSMQDGLNCIWLVDEKGDYKETTEREYLLKYYSILKISRQTDLYGIYGKPLSSFARETKMRTRHSRAKPRTATARDQRTSAALERSRRQSATPGSSSK